MKQDPLDELGSELDREDPLVDFRKRFLLTDDLIYLDGNSLGPLPAAAALAVQCAVASEWGDRLIRSWNENWLDLQARVSSKIARLIGADDDEVLVCDSTSVNFYKLACAVKQLAANRRSVVAEDFSFPTNLYILEGLFGAANVRRVISPDGVRLPAERVMAAMDDDVALVSLNHVNYRSGWLHPVTQLNAAASAKKILCLWDLSHSVGVVPINVRSDGIELAVGCTYKYLCGGPGAPAFVYVRRELQNLLGNPIQGWFGHGRFFDFADAYSPAADVKRFQTGTPPILSMAAMEAGLDLVLEAGLQAIREKSERMSEYFLSLTSARLADCGFALRTPDRASERGSHISLGHPKALPICSALIRERNVIPDFRPPDCARFGFSPLFNRFSELAQAVDRVRQVTLQAEWLDAPLPRTRVT